MGELTGISTDLPYEDRLKRLRKSGIALWDVCASAERVGALDAKIQFKTIVPNDFPSFFDAHKCIELICFNGKAAERLFCRKALADLPPAAKTLRREVLPSTSPAFASMRFEEKLSRWREALCQVVQCRT
jgi:double-stranded uracil-DNA glycosylase